MNPAAAAPEAAPLVSCPAGAPLGGVDLQVQSGAQQLPFRTINRLSEGDILLYRPILRGKETRSGEIALVLIPEKRKPGDPDILVTDPKAADKPQQWKMDRTISVAAIVYGPSGLSRKKVAKFLSRDEVLIAQLADYADKTAQAEQLVATLSNAASSADSINAALSGFASQYGFAVQINRNAPVSAQAATVFAAMNPQLATYNPLASSGAQSVGQSASLATMAGTLFFGSPVGLAAGGTAMLLDLRMIAFPDTQFRASFAQAVPKRPAGVNLCGQQGPLPPHTRAAYIWASRIPNISAPPIHIGAADFVPATQKSPVPVDVPDEGWKYLDRVRDWTLVSGTKKVAIPVVKLANQHSLEMDLTKGSIPAGDYKLTGFWDWTPIEAAGVVHVLPLSDFKGAHLDPASQDRLLAKSGKVPVTVTGSDFEFTTKTEIKKLNDKFATAEAVPFLLPKGLRDGPQDQMDLQIDTGTLDPGVYDLLITQQDGKSHPIEFKVLPSPPEISNLPILVNQGAMTQHFVLKGHHLDRVSKLQARDAVLTLGPPGADQTERSLTVKLQASQKPGDVLPVTQYVQDRNEPMTLPDALQVTGPLPVIASSKLSLPTGLAIAVRSEEFPAGYTLNATLDVKNVERQSVLRLACSDGVGKTARMQIGEQTGAWNLQQLSPDQLFLAFDTTGMPAGCSLQAVIDNGRDGASTPFTLAHIVRLPQIETFTAENAPPRQNGARGYQLTGQNLELIAKLGWDEKTGTEVSGMPAPLPGPGLKQSTEVDLPDPPAAGSTLYIWLRGDAQARATTLTAPALPLETTSTSVVSSMPGSAVGQEATFTAVVTPGAATGTVTIMDGQTALGTATLASGQATFTTSQLRCGAHSITAKYNGDAHYAGSVSPAVTQQVNLLATTTSLTSAPNPPAAGKPVTLTAAVAVSDVNAGPAAGIVTFSLDGSVLGTATLDDNGTATFSTPALTAGKHMVKAVYAGSPKFSDSASDPLVQIVQ